MSDSIQVKAHGHAMLWVPAIGVDGDEFAAEGAGRPVEENAKCFGCVNSFRNGAIFGEVCHEVLIRDQVNDLGVCMSKGERRILIYDTPEARGLYIRQKMERT